MLSLPEDLQRAIDESIPADGQIHVQRRGRFQISADTLFCAESNTFAVGVDTRPLSTRDKCIVTTGREDVPPQTVFMTGRQLPNREGRPYKLVLAIWQGQSAHGAYWVGSVERSDGHHPEVSIGIPGGPAADEPTPDQIEDRKAEMSIRQDARELSAAFARALGSR